MQRLEVESLAIFLSYLPDGVNVRAIHRGLFFFQSCQQQIKGKFKSNSGSRLRSVTSFSSLPRERSKLFAAVIQPFLFFCKISKKGEKKN